MYSPPNQGLNVSLNHRSPFPGISWWISWMNLNSNALTCFIISTVLYFVEGGREDYVSSGWTASWKEKFEVPLAFPLSLDCMTHVFFLRHAGWSRLTLNPMTSVWVFSIFIYLAILGLSCSMQDLWSLLWHEESFFFFSVVVWIFLVAACGI